jgi:hypothetical protein
VTPPAECSRIVRERHYEAPDLAVLALLLRRERFSGAVTLNFVEGGLGSADVIESQKLTFDTIPLDNSLTLPAQSRT